MNITTIDPSSDTRTFKAARRCLENWLKQNPTAYRSLFEEGAVEHSELPGDISPLRELGLLDISDSMLLASKCIYPFDGMFILCDRPSNQNLERVFPIFSDESILLARWMTVRTDDVVLDLGTGSGIVALVAAKQDAGKVFASDVDEHVKKYFEMTVQLNNLAGHIEYVDSDVFDSLEGQRFDVIATNPPFVPVPKKLKYYVHSDGGTLGTAIIERILHGVSSHLNTSGRFYMLALSLGGPNGWRINSLLPAKKKNPNSNLIYHSEPIYTEPLENLSNFTELFGMAVDYAEWVHELDVYGYGQLGYFAVNSDVSTVSARKILHRLRHEQALAGLPFWQDYVGTMKNRLRRY